MGGLLALVIASTMLALPSLAEGSTVGLDGEGALVIEAEPREENDVFVGATVGALLGRAASTVARRSRGPRTAVTQRRETGRPRLPVTAS